MYYVRLAPQPGWTPQLFTEYIRSRVLLLCVVLTDIYRVYQYKPKVYPIIAPIVRLS